MTARFQCRECTCWFPGEGPVCEECQRRNRYRRTDEQQTEPVVITLGPQPALTQETVDKIVKGIKDAVGERDVWIFGATESE